MRRTATAVALLLGFAPAAAWPQQTAGDNSAGTSANSNKGSVYEQLNLFGEAFERIRHDAVDPVADQKLVQTAITGMLASLDPHSVYLTEDEYKALQSRTPDTSATPGLVVTIDNSEVKVVAPRDGSPAASADVKPGDLIFSIDKEPTYDLTLPQVEQKLRGPAGSEVSLLMRRGTGKPMTIKIKRAAGPFPTVTHRLDGPDIGYIRLAAFDDGTPDALAAAVKDLRQQAGSKLKIGR